MSMTQSVLGRPPSLENFVRRIDEISTLPQIAMKVMQVANNPNSSAGDLKAVLEGDAALSARVLRCVNSSAYAIRTRITNLQHAIAYLGLKQVRNLAMTASVSELFRTDEVIASYSRTQLWRHLVSVGICARLIALRRNVAGFEDAFLAGLLHDIGIILIDQHLHAPFRELMSGLDSRRTLGEQELAAYGFDHTALGWKVAELWGFPEPARMAIRWHHASAGYRGDEIDVVRCVEVANIICTLKGISAIGEKLVRISQPAVVGLGLTRDDLVVLSEDLDREIEANAGLFQV